MQCEVQLYKGVRIEIEGLVLSRSYRIVCGPENPQINFFSDYAVQQTTLSKCSGYLLFIRRKILNFVCFVFREVE